MAPEEGRHMRECPVLGTTGPPSHPCYCVGAASCCAYATSGFGFSSSFLAIRSVLAVGNSGCQPQVSKLGT